MNPGLSHFPRGLLPLALLFACSEDTTPGPSDLGPTDTGGVVDRCGGISDPCRLEPGMPQQELIAPVGDQDSYRFDVMAGQVVEVVVENPEIRRPIQLRAVLFDPSGSAVLSAQHTGGPSQPQTVSLNFPARDGGAYRVDVSDVGNDEEDPNPAAPYSIRLTLMEQTDDNEPNDGPEEATALEFDAPISGQIGTPGDADWFQFQVPDHQLVRIDASGTMGDVPFQWELLREGALNSPIATASQPWSVTQRAVGTRGGLHYLRVTAADPSASSLERIYTLTVSLIPEPDPNEQTALNDTADLATPVALGSQTTGLVASAGDIDFYAFTVTGASANDPVVVEAEMTSNNVLTPVNLEFALLGSNGMVLPPDIRNSEPGVPDEPGLALRRLNRGDQLTRQGEIRCHDDTSCRTAHPIFEDGTYFVRVRDRNETQFDAEAGYTLDLRALPDVDATENYGTGQGSARTITTSTVTPVLDYGWVEGYISYTGDEDWYRFVVPTEGFEENPPQDGDWELNYEMELNGPTEVEFFMQARRPDRRDETPTPNPCSGMPSEMRRDPCDRTPMQNETALNFDIGGIAGNQCTFIFREEADRRNDGDIFVRIFDVSWLPGTTGDDYSVTVPYRFRLRLKAGCDPDGPCSGEVDCGGM